MLTIYKNRESGKHFIFIKEIDTDTGSFITPQNKERAIGFNLFQEDSFEDDEKNLLDNGIVTPEQVIRYELYKKDRDDEGTDNFIDMVIELIQQQGRSFNDVLSLIDEMLKKNKNDKFNIKLRERILEEMEEL